MYVFELRTLVFRWFGRGAGKRRHFSYLQVEKVFHMIQNQFADLKNFLITVDCVIIVYFSLPSSPQIVLIPRSYDIA